MNPMKDSGIEWIGKIPSDWDVIRLKNTSTLKGRIGWQGLRTDEYIDEGPYLVTGTDFINGVIDWKTCAHVSDARYEMDINIQIREGDLLVTKDGTIGKTAIAKNCPQKAALNSGVFIVRNDKQYKYFGRYMYYIMNSNEFVLWYELSQQGNSTIRHLTQDRFYNFAFTYPEYNLQVLIANYLDKKCEVIDSLSEDIQSEIDTLEAYKRSVITEAVTKGLDKNAPMKDSQMEWIGDIPSHWKVTPFRAYVIERMEKNKYKQTTELLALSFALGVTLYKDKIYNKDRVKENFEEYNVVHKNDLVLSPNDIIKGSIFVSEYDGCISPMYHIFSARNTETHNLYYLSYLLRTKEAGRRFFFIARGLIGSILENGKYVTRRMTVSRQDLLSFKVLLPPYKEQTEIVDYLDKKCAEIDSIIEDKQKQLAIINDYKKSIIYEYVTGKKEVPTA